VARSGPNCVNYSGSVVSLCELLRFRSAENILFSGIQICYTYTN